jgi:homocysteine S-methyltransferase
MRTTTATTPRPLPLPEDTLCLTDGGMETTLIFDEGLELPHFAAFVLLEDDAGRAALDRYYTPYLDIAVRDGVPISLDTPTWRANPDWGARLGYDAAGLADITRRAVQHVARHRVGGTPILVNAAVGPRGDGYVAGEQMTLEEARRYHSAQLQVAAEAGADLASALTMTYPSEGAGVALAARDAGLPVVVSFTVETDGRLPSGHTLEEAVGLVDDATDAAPATYMVNCAHPTHFLDRLDPSAAWTARIGAVRANASRLSHAELDEAEELDGGDPADLARQFLRLREALPALRMIGGCCGTTHEHVAAVSAALLAGR